MYFLHPNQKKFLESLNPVIILAFFYAVLVSRTTVEYVLPGMLRGWDILLPFIVYFGQRRSVAEGLTLSILTAHLYSLCSSAPVGVYVLHYLTLFIVARILSYVIYANRWVTIFVLLLSLSVLSRIIRLPIASLFGHSTPEGWIGGFFYGIVLNSLLGFCFYLFIAFLDRLTFKAPRVSIEMMGDEL